MLILSRGSGNRLGPKGGTEGTWLQLLRSCTHHLLQVSQISKAECNKVGNYQEPGSVRVMKIRDLEWGPEGEEESDKRIQYSNRSEEHTSELQSP